MSLSNWKIRIKKAIHKAKKYFILILLHYLCEKLYENHGFTVATITLHTFIPDTSFFKKWNRFWFLNGLDAVESKKTMTSTIVGGIKE